MADIFVSYARVDKDFVESLAHQLEAAGYSLWWDREIVGGSEFSKDIERELDSAKYVLVVWSEAAIDSPWVKDEATAGLSAGKMVPISIGGTEPPLGFRQYQAIDFSQWRGGSDGEDFAGLKRALSHSGSGGPESGALDVKAGSKEQASGRVGNSGSTASDLLQGSKPKWFAAIAVAAVLVVAVFIGFGREGAEHSSSEGGSDPAAPLAQESVTLANLDRRAAIAVLPFVNASADVDQTYFADGITIDIISRLQALRLFPIISQSSSFLYRGESVDVKKIGSDLGVDYIVEGSIQRSGNRIRVTAQLIEVENGFSIWSNTFNKDFGDLFILQDEITQSIAAKLAPEIKRSEISRARAKPTDNLDAYDHYLRGVRLSRAEEFSAVLAARESLLEARRLDANFAAPLVELGWIEHDLITYYSDETTFERSTEARDKALAYGESAIALDPYLAEGHALFGHMLLHFGKLEQGLAELDQARTLNPSSSFIINYHAWALILNGLYDEAFEALDMAQRLNPSDPRVWEMHSNRAYALLAMGRYKEASEDVNRSLVHNESNPYSYMTLVSCYYRAGDLEQATLAVENLKRVAPNFSTRSLDLTSFSRKQIEGFRADLAAMGWVDPS